MAAPALQYCSFEEVSRATAEFDVESDDSRVSPEVLPLWRRVRELSLGNLASEGLVRPATSLPDPTDPPLVSTGVAELDALAGGFPRGGLSEVCGPASCGRTSVMLATLREMTRRKEVCALVDVSDSFDPLSADTAGIDLTRLLWVRCTSTPPKRARFASENALQMPVKLNRKVIFSRVEQALKTTDLLLQAGGFGMIAIDMADIPVSVARRVPMTSWFRFRRVVENTPTVLMVLERDASAKSCASLVLKLRRTNYEAQDAARPTHTHLLTGLGVSAEVVRSCAQQKKPVRAVSRFEFQVSTCKAG